MPHADAPVIVLLHGFGDSPHCLEPFVRAVGALHRVTAHLPAASGHGGAPASPSGLVLPALVEAAVPAVRAAADAAGAPVVVGGHSMGAATAARLAGEHPELVAGLFLEDPCWNWPPTSDPDPAVAQQTQELRGWIHDMQRLDHAGRVAWCRMHNPGWPQDEYDPWARGKSAVDPVALEQGIDLFRHDWRSSIAGVACPTVLVVGEPALGSQTHPEVVAEVAGLPGWRVHQVVGAGHDVRRVGRRDCAAAMATLLPDAGP